MDDWVQRRIQQALNQTVRCVIRAARLALVADELGEAEASAVGADLRGERQQALVDAAQLLGAEVLVVHGAQDFPLTGEGEVAQGFEEVVIGELGAFGNGRMVSGEWRMAGGE